MISDGRRDDKSSGFHHPLPHSGPSRTGTVASPRWLDRPIVPPAILYPTDQSPDNIWTAFLQVDYYLTGLSTLIALAPLQVNLNFLPPTPPRRTVSSPEKALILLLVLVGSRVCFFFRHGDRHLRLAMQSQLVRKL